MFGFSRKEDLGEPIFNLSIHIKCEKRSFEDRPITSIEDQIEEIGFAIHKAKKIIGGRWHFTDKGYLVKEFVSGLDQRSAVLEIDEISINGIEILEKALNGSIKPSDFHDWPHIHYVDSQSISLIRTDENRKLRLS